MATGAAPQKLVAQWSTDDVTSWLKKLKLDNVSSKFKKNNVTGHDLEVLTTDEIQQLGASKAEAGQIKSELSHMANEQYTADGHDKDDDDGVMSREASISVDTSSSIPAVAPLTPELKPKASPRGPSDSPINLDSATLQQYVDALRVISEIEATGAEIHQPMEEAKLKSVTDLHRCKAAEFDDVQKTLKYYKTKKTAAGVGTTLGQFLGGAHSKEAKAEVVASIEQQIADAQRKVDVVSEAMQQLKAQKEQQNTVVVQLRAQVTRLQDARQFEANVTSSVFSGAAGDARENQLEAAVDAEIPKLEQLRSSKAAFQMVQEMLKSALQKLETAENNYKNASHLHKVDWVIHKVTGYKGGVVTDVAKQSNVLHATSLAESAVIELSEAKKLIPDLPKLDAAKLEAMKSGGFKPLYSDINLTQKEIDKNLKSNLKEVKKLDSYTESALGWVQKWLTKRIEVDLQKAQASFNIKKTALDLYRRELMQAEIKRRGIA